MTDIKIITKSKNMKPSTYVNALGAFRGYFY
jgi:hypothetical protein